MALGVGGGVGGGRGPPGGAAAGPSTVVPKRAAISVSVSPGWTTYSDMNTRPGAVFAGGAGTSRRWPGTTRPGSVRPFRATTTSTVVRKKAATSDRLSPGRTVYSTVATSGGAGGLGGGGGGGG